MFKPSKLRTEPGESPLDRAATTQIESPAPTNDPFRESLIALLTEVGAIANRVKACATGELPAGAGSILQILERHGSQTVPQIARKRVTSRQNIQILVNRLAREGFIEFSHNPAHKRSVLVVLTPKGAEMLEKAAKRQQEFLHGLGAEISEQELVAAATLLRKIREAILEQSSMTPKSADPEPATSFQTTSQRHKEEPERGSKEDVSETDLPFNLL